MSTREMAHAFIDTLTEEQLQAFVTLFGKSANHIHEVEPDEWDKEMIADSKDDNEESMPLDKFVKELGFNPDNLRI